MLRILGSPKTLCDGLTRRDMLWAGGLGLFGLGLPALRLASLADMAEGLVDGDFKVGEVYRLGQEIECATVHRGSDIGHVAIGREDDSESLYRLLVELLKQRQAVHPRHVDVAHHHLDIGVLL